MSQADSIIAFVGRDYVMMGANAAAGFSIILMKQTEDRIKQLDSSKCMVINGKDGDRVQFGEYIQKNMALNKFKTDRELSTHAAANFIRLELATALRRNPYETNVLLGGYDAHKKTNQFSVYYMDYLASMQKVQFGAQGYAQYFCLSLFDKFYKPDLSISEGKALMKLCIAQVQSRLVLNQPHFIVKIITKDGVQTIDLNEDTEDKGKEVAESTTTTTTTTETTEAKDDTSTDVEMVQA